MVQAPRIPSDPGEARLLASLLAREVNLYVLFLHTWSAMGFVVNPGVIADLLGLQEGVVAAIRAIDEGGDHRKPLAEVLGQEEAIFRRLMEEIKGFKEETEDFFPSLKLKFDPCF